MTALAHRVILAWGWPRRLIALFAGAIGALAMPPFGIWPLLIVAMTVAVWLVDGSAHGGRGGRWATIRAAAAAGWWFGFGYFVAGLWWLGAAFLVEAEEFAWALPLGVLGLPAGLAVFPALGFALARLLWPAGGMRLLGLAAGLGASEWLRGHVLTGFPWNSFGMAFGQHPLMAQAASVVGLYGLTLAAVAICAAPATLGTEEGRARWTAPLLALLALIGLAGYGLWRIPQGPTATVVGVKLRIMQPNLPQDAKFRPDNKDGIMQRYLTLSDRATSPQSNGVGDATHLIWPESAFPFLLARDPAALAQIAALLPTGTTLITGAARADTPLPGETAYRFYNSIYVIRDDGTIIGTYDKVHLVPFGEYLPLGALLQRLGLRQFVHVPGGFEAGTRRAPLSVPGLSAAAPLICYEAIFPGEVVPDGQRPVVLLNVTNDAWFGLTPGPYQHLAQARLRAVEEGLPLVRAANTGISAVVDAYGRIVERLPLGVEGVLDSQLPAAINTTIYARFRDVSFLVVIVCFAAFSFAARSRG
ncbi:apolipoprotein N-acyltransferase [Chelatococcus sp. SYSU_G07232]|uniref:Apolipoprotein N-acyltransferase n=1 Tax=Chelatococcus albus TaxID=3047466 RepID=A0ABT7AID4_9HYPH|nr:apolipoprotein N-acyltransferase [Chelatococcus sp. SYSU_G07232]MDJ1158752.1 apolipoprotein N-acyltransferase [Chelatococcus sp. SYSU_G07232]